MERTTDNKKQNKNSFILYLYYSQAINALSNEDAGELIKGIYSYVAGNGVPELSPISNIVFLLIQPKLRDDLEKWRDTCKKNKENIGKRWNKENTTGTNGINKNTNHTEGEGDYEYESDSESDSETKVNNKLTSDLIFSIQEKKLIKVWESTEPGKEIIDQCVKLLKYKLKEGEVDIDKSHYEQLTGWVMEYIKKKPGNNYLITAHNNLLVSDFFKEEFIEEEEKIPENDEHLLIGKKYLGNSRGGSKDEPNSKKE